MRSTLWWPKSALFLTQQPPRRNKRAGRTASLIAGLVLAIALLALVGG